MFRHPLLDSEFSLGLAPTIIETSSCWLLRLGFSSPTLRPWRSTTARSASSTTCSMLWVIRITALPSAQLQDQVEDLARLAQAERRGRLVEDHHLAREHGGARHGDGLALAARHQRHRRIELRQLHLEPVDHRGRLAVHGLLVEKAQACGQPARDRRSRGRNRSSAPASDCRTAQDPGRRFRCRPAAPRQAS